LLPRQGFRRDGKLFVLPAETAKHADAQIYGAFVQQLQGQTATKFVEIFKANAKNNVNLRAAGNALLVLNKIKTVRLLSLLVSLQNSCLFGIYPAALVFAHSLELSSKSCHYVKMPKWHVDVVTSDLLCILYHVCWRHAPCSTQCYVLPSSLTQRTANVNLG